MKRRDGRALDHETLEEIWIRAVERVQAGESREVVIRALGFSRSCIYTWLARYRSGGWHALRAGALKGRPTRIKPAQLRWLYGTVVGKSPLQFRFEFALWTREMIRIGIDLPTPTVSRHRAGPGAGAAVAGGGVSSHSRPGQEGGRRDLLWRRSGRAQRQSRGNDLGIKGQTPVVRRSGQRGSVNMISAVSARASCVSC